MINIFLSLFLMLLLPLSSLSAFPSKNQECTKCHTLTKEEAGSLLKTFDKNIKIVAVRKGPVKYLWEIDVETKGKKAIIYIDLPKKNVFSGSLISVQGRVNLTQERLSDLNKVNVSQIPLQDALLIGDKKAKNKIIVFDDPE